MAVKQHSDGGPDGQKFGQSSTDLIGFYGASPVARQTATTAPSATAAVSVSATQWGFSTSTQADALVATVRALNTALTNLGLHG